MRTVHNIEHILCTCGEYNIEITALDTRLKVKKENQLVLKLLFEPRSSATNDYNATEALAQREQPLSWPLAPPFTLISLNARSMLNKVTEIETEFLTYEPDVAVVTETWLNEQVSSGEVFPAGYNPLSKDRSSRDGGVAILVRDTIPCSLGDRSSGDEIIWA